MLSDDQLILTCALDAGAFRELMQRYQGRIHGYLRYRVGRDGAEDLFQEFWLKVLKASPRYQARGLARAWLFKIAHGLALNHLARSRTAPAALSDGAEEVRDQGPTPAVQFETADLKVRLEEALSELPEEQREVFLMREVAQLSFREIAEDLDLPLGTVLSRMHYAIKKLRARLGPNHD